VTGTAHGLTVSIFSISYIASASIYPKIKIINLLLCTKIQGNRFANMRRREAVTEQLIAAGL
jgi:hypothetical protein